MAGCAEGSERALQFVRLWTLKEAYVKAVGRGIGARPGLKAFSVSLKRSSNGMQTAVSYALSVCVSLQHSMLLHVSLHGRLTSPTSNPGPLSIV